MKKPAPTATQAGDLTACDVEVSSKDSRQSPIQPSSTGFSTEDHNLVKTIESLRFELAQSEIKCEQHKFKIDSMVQTLTNKEEIIVELVKKHGQLRSKFHAEEKYLQETLITKERHLNEVIMKIRYESDMKQRELFDARSKNDCLSQSLVKRNEQLRVQVCDFLSLTNLLICRNLLTFPSPVFQSWRILKTFEIQYQKNNIDFLSFDSFRYKLVKA